MRGGGAGGCGVEVGDDLLQVLRHPLQLAVQALRQLTVETRIVKYRNSFYPAHLFVLLILRYVNGTYIFPTVYGMGKVRQVIYQ
jgi:hypothetical protein